MTLDEDPVEARDIDNGEEQIQSLFQTIIGQGEGTEAVDVQQNGKVRHVFIDDVSDPLTNLNLGKFVDIEYPRL